LEETLSARIEDQLGLSWLLEGDGRTGIEYKEQKISRGVSLPPGSSASAATFPPTYYVQNPPELSHS